MNDPSIARRDTSPDFIEAVARGFDIIRSFEPGRPAMSLSELATASSLPRPTARRILITLEELGYVRSSEDGFALTPRVLELGTAYIASIDLWDIVRPHLSSLAAATGETSSLAQLDGSDIVWVARVAVPKLVALRVTIGSRLPALATSQGKVLLAALDPAELERTLAVPNRSAPIPHWHPERDQIDAELGEVRSRGWALTDKQLSRSIRSVAVPVRNSAGAVVAAMNVNTHAGETTIDTLIEHHLPLLLAAAAAASADWARVERLPAAIVTPHPVRPAGQAELS